jgi:hypothetical protein
MAKYEGPSFAESLVVRRAARMMPLLAARTAVNVRPNLEHLRRTDIDTLIFSVKSATTSIRAIVALFDALGRLKSPRRR